MNWWVSSILHTGQLWNANLNSLLPLPPQPPGSLSCQSLADCGHRLIQRSKCLLLPISTWMCWKVCFHLVLKLFFHVLFSLRCRCLLWFQKCFKGFCTRASQGFDDCMEMKLDSGVELYLEWLQLTFLKLREWYAPHNLVNSHQASTVFFPY